MFGRWLVVFLIVPFPLSSPFDVTTSGLIDTIALSNTTTTPRPPLGLKQCQNNYDCRSVGYICSVGDGVHFCIPKLPCKSHDDCMSLNCNSGFCHPSRVYCIPSHDKKLMDTQCSGGRLCLPARFINGLGECL